MDNLIVGLTGATCFVMAESATNWLDSVTPLGIVGLVVYFFLFKFDKKMDWIVGRIQRIDNKIDKVENDVDEVKREVKHNEQNS